MPNASTSQLDRPNATATGAERTAQDRATFEFKGVSLMAFFHQGKEEAEVWLLPQEAGSGFAESLMLEDSGENGQWAGPSLRQEGKTHITYFVRANEKVIVDMRQGPSAPHKTIVGIYTPEGLHFVYEVMPRTVGAK